MNRALPSASSSAPSRRVWLSQSGERARVWLLCALVATLASVLPILYALHFDKRNGERREGLFGWRALETLELRGLDERFARRGPQTPRFADRIAIVGLDESSYARINRVPVPRALHARLIQRLQQAGARVIAFDIGFSARQNPRDDAALSRALQNANGRAILASSLDESTTSQSTTHRTVTPLDEFDEHTPDLALTWMPRDSDGRARRFALRTRVNGANVGSLSALAAATYQKLLEPDLKPYERALQGNWPTLNGKRVRVPLAASRPDERAPQHFTTPLLFWGPPNSFATHSFAPVLWDYSPTQLREKFNGRIVFVGSTAQLDKDVFQTPDFRAERAPETFGVELHATATAMLLEGRYLRAPSLNAQIALIVFMAALSGAWTRQLGAWSGAFARRAQGQWAAWNAPGRVFAFSYLLVFGIGASLPILGLQFAAQFALSRDWWLFTVYPTLAALSASGVLLLLLYGSEASERRRVTSHMGRLVSPDVLDELLAHPEGVSLAPQRRQVTVLFTDLQGFTSFAEANSPEDVAWARQAYLDRMTPLVHAHGGTLDKFIGDAVMAFFGAPLPRFDHAAQALHCAVAMQEECARFRDETGIPFFMRIGVHTGNAVVGLMGDERAEYTVVGDTVNLASRLESLNKQFNSRVLCSDDTERAAQGAVFVERHETQVRGKRDAISVCVVRGLTNSDDSRWHPLPENDALDALPEAASQSHESASTFDNEQRALPALPAPTEVANS